MLDSTASNTQRYISSATVTKYEAQGLGPQCLLIAMAHGVTFYFDERYKFYYPVGSRIGGFFSEQRAAIAWCFSNYKLPEEVTPMK